MVKVPWKLNDNPDKVLGPSQSLLNPIRTSCCVYIALKRVPREKQHWFWVYGSNLNVKKAKKRIVTIQKNLAVSDAARLSFFLIKPVDFKKLAKRVKLLTDYRELHDLDGNPLTLRDQPLAVFKFTEEKLNAEEIHEITGNYIASISDLDAGDVRVANIGNINSQYLAHWFEKVVEPLRSCIGEIEMKIAIGMAVFLRYPPPAGFPSAIPDFEQLLSERNNDQNKLATISLSELGDLKTETVIYDRFNSSEYLKYVVYDFGRIKTQPPKCSLNIIMANPTNSGTKALLLLKLDWPSVKSSPNAAWYHYPKDQDPASLTDLTVNILDLAEPHFSFSLAIERKLRLNSTEEANLPERWTSFSQHITLDSIFVESFLTDPTYTGKIYNFDCVDKPPPLISIEQRRTWSYQWSKTQDYIVDLGLFQVVHCKPNTPREPFKYRFSEPRWSVDLSHAGWVTNFNENTHLLPGGKDAEWRALESDWFPIGTGASTKWGKSRGDEGTIHKRGSGVKLMLDILDKVVRVMKDEPVQDEEEDELGGGVALMDGLVV